MKVGDKLIYIQDYKIFFKSGNIYKIDYISKSYIPHTIIIRSDDNTTVGNTPIGFNGKDMLLFDDYFYNINEQRKEKLEKIKKKQKNTSLE